jgi:hypothetical protein
MAHDVHLFELDQATCEIAEAVYELVTNLFGPLVTIGIVDLLGCIPRDWIDQFLFGKDVGNKAV